MIDSFVFDVTIFSFLITTSSITNQDKGAKGINESNEKYKNENILHIVRNIWYKYITKGTQTCWKSYISIMIFAQKYVYYNDISFSTRLEQKHEEVTHIHEGTIREGTSNIQ